MNTFLILRGLPGCGKSTFAKQLVTENPGKWKRINKDDMRAMLDGVEWDRRGEYLLAKICEDMAWKCLWTGYNVVSDNTNLNPDHIKSAMKLINQAREVEKMEPTQFQLKVLDFVTPIEVCIERDALRPTPIGEEAIRIMAAQWVKDGRFPDISNIIAKGGPNDRHETKT